jgi:hypothetical protein
MQNSELNHEVCRKYYVDERVAINMENIFVSDDRANGVGRVLLSISTIIGPKLIEVFWFDTELWSEI